MFSNRTGISRSFHAPHGVNVGAAAKQPLKVKRKHSWASSRMRSALSEGGIAPRPVTLKEGVLNKPSFFRFGGKKRRWCVVRTYSHTEAALDVYLDESRSRYKGSISLDKESNPILYVKNTDGKHAKKASKCYFSVKVGKNAYSFTADSFRELKEWCSLVRQAMDNGNLFSGQIIEPKSLDDGMVNIKFNSNCIALLCPLKETPIKTWRLDHITSFGQCGGILTFESCPSCSDPGAARCSVNIVQEKPAHILNIMERAIRSNPNTREIHYERSILGDIYHCSHDCGQPRLLPAFSEPNIFGTISTTPTKGLVNVAVDLHHSGLYMPSSNAVDSTDSGLPGTPQAEESMSISSSIPSPTSRSAHGLRQRDSAGSPYRSPSHSTHVAHKARSMSDSKPSWQSDNFATGRGLQRGHSDESSPRHSPVYPPDESGRNRNSRLAYATISHDSSPKLVKKEELKATPSTPLQPSSSSVTYSAIQTDESCPQLCERRQTYNHLHPVTEDDSIYDVPNCEPEDNPFSPPITPLPKDSRSSSNSVRSSQADYPVHTPSAATAGSTNTAWKVPKTSVVSTMSGISCYLPGSDLSDRNEDYEELPPVPLHRNRRGHYLGRVSPTKQIGARRNGVAVSPMLPQQRARLKSSSDVLESPSLPHIHNMRLARLRGSMDNLDQLGQNGHGHSIYDTDLPSYNNRQLKGSTDLLERLQREEEQLKLVLQDSKKECKEELAEVPEPSNNFNRAYKFGIDDLEYDEPDPDVILETSSNLLDYRAHVYSNPSAERVLTKVASDTVRGYAYKIAIPVANAQYDVPRRLAPVPDLAHLRSDAPPKPIRYTSTENLFCPSS